MTCISIRQGHPTRIKFKTTYLKLFPFTTISLALSVRNVFIRERANETDWDDDDGVDDNNKIVISADGVI